jgi:putative mRNA 3-end processing factor
VWRDGVHIVGTSLWCDAIRARDICFVSSAEALKSKRHGQLIATPASLALLAGKWLRPDHHLAVPYGRPFTVGTTRLELFSTGHAIGSAGLWLRDERGDVVYAGDINPRGGAGGQLDSRAGDTLIIAVHYGDPGYRFECASSSIVDFCAEVTAGGVAVLLVTSPLKGLELTALLEDRFELWLAPPIHQCASKLGWCAPERETVPRRASIRSARPGRVMIWPVDRRERLPALPGNSRVALVSGEHPDSVGVEHRFAWSNRADYNQLVAFIEGVGASQVYVTGRFNESFARALDRPGRRVLPLGPPRQLSLL